MAVEALSGLSTEGEADGQVSGSQDTIAYQALLSKMLPRGKAWTREPGTVLQDLLAGFAPTFARVHERAVALLLEMDPRAATETIRDWERVTRPYAPDAAPASLAARRVAVTGVWVSRGGWAGGPSTTFFESLAATLGYTLTIRRFHRRPFTCVSKCTDNLNTAQEGWLQLWEFIAVSQGPAVDAVFEEQIERYALGHLAHTVAFPLLDAGAATFTRASAAVLRRPNGGTATNIASGVRGELFHGV